jgi:hypothetical protein
MRRPGDIGAISLQNAPIRILEDEAGNFRFGPDDENGILESDRTVDGGPKKMPGFDPDLLVDDDIFLEIYSVLDLDEIPRLARAYGGLDRQIIMRNIEDLRMQERRLERQQNKGPSRFFQRLFLKGTIYLLKDISKKSQVQLNSGAFFE